MKIIYADEFDEQLSNIKDKTIAKLALNTVLKLKNANFLREVPNVKAMKNYPSFYRIRFSSFRIGFRVVDENTIRLLAIDHRSKFYRDFPEKFA